MGKSDEAGACSQDCQEGEVLGMGGTWLLHIALF